MQSKKRKNVVTLCIIEMTFVFSFKKPISMGVISSTQTDVNQPAQGLKATYMQNTLLGKNLQICTTETHSFFQSTDPEVLATAGAAVFKTWSLPR